MKGDFNETDSDKISELELEIVHLRDVNTSLKTVIREYEDLLNLLYKDVPGMPKVALFLIRQALFISLKEAPK